jgi:hypothetical protein
MFVFLKILFLIWLDDLFFPLSSPFWIPLVTRFQSGYMLMKYWLCFVAIITFGFLDHVDICMCVCVCVQKFSLLLSDSHTVFPFFLFFSFPITCNCGSLPLRRQYCLRLIHPHGPWPGSREAKVYIHTRRNGRYIEDTFWNRVRKKSIRTAQAYIEKSSPFPPCI